MAKLIRLTAVQPPFADEVVRNSDIVNEAHRLVELAGKLGSDIVLLPELINIYETIEIDIAAKAGRELPALVESFAVQAKKHGMYVILPVAEAREDGLYNSSIILGRDGKAIGRYDKTHISRPEVQLYPNIKPGKDLPTFDLDFGRIGIMTCYDCYFPEVAIVYDLKGVEVLFYPRWQSGPSEMSLDVQMRCRALDHCMFLVSSSFGVRDGVPWKPGMLFGRSCIIGRDGTVLSDAGHGVGLASSVVDIQAPRLIECMDSAMGEGMIEDYRSLIRQDRRPELYKLIGRLA